MLVAIPEDLTSVSSAHVGSSQLHVTPVQGIQNLHTMADTQVYRAKFKKKKWDVSGLLAVTESTPPQSLTCNTTPPHLTR